MAENILLGALRRYEFYSYCSTLIKTLYNTVTQDLYGDVHWEWSYSNTNSMLNLSRWNTGLNRGMLIMGTITAQNIKDPSMFFTICMNSSRYNYDTNNSHGSHSKNYVLRTGLKK